VIDPQDVRWIWLTHPDRDHTGGLFDLLEAAPEARLVTTFLGAGIMSLERPVPMDRVYLLNPGQTLDVGDRTLTAFRPPLFDNPSTVGFYDDRSRTCFTSDCFGAPVSSAELAGCSDVGEVAGDDLRAGQLLWAAVDSPWVHTTDAAAFLDTTRPLRTMDPEIILSTHLPPAIGRTPEFLDMLVDAPQADPFVGPDQRALEEMLASFEPVVAAS
jgi:L-ascorbate metabolism protein UlaG (beta-lactamase superfamily)